MDGKRLYILAGANGSGKSTLSKVLLPESGIVYVNPDDIARKLCPDDISKARIEAGKEALRSTNAMLERGESFAIESTLSGVAYVRLLKRAKLLGYETAIAYVFVDSPEVCIKRIKARVMNGGHGIPDEDVIRRYSRSKDNFLNVYRPLVDQWMLYYNGGADISLVAHGNGETIVISRERYGEFLEGV